MIPQPLEQALLPDFHSVLVNQFSQGSHQDAIFADTHSIGEDLLGPHPLVVGFQCPVPLLLLLQVL